MWYKPDTLLSHNKLINMVIGPRGFGKTYSCKRWCINDFLKTGKQFVWIRRYKTELKKKTTFFSDIAHEFSEHQLEIKGMNVIIDKKIAGYFLALSTGITDKSTSYPDVNKIIYDEFVIDKSAVRYLPNEVETFLEVFETIARMRDNVRAVLLSNAVSIVNPYFLYWGIKPKPGYRFTKSNMICIEFFSGEEFIVAKKKTRFGQLVDGTAYGKYAIDNEYLRDNDTFVQQKTPEAEFMCAIKFNSNIYRFWLDYKEGLIFCNKQHDPYSYNIYCLTKEDHEPNLLLIHSIRDNRHIENIKFCFKQGLIRFSDMSVKNQFYEMLRLLYL